MTPARREALILAAAGVAAAAAGFLVGPLLLKDKGREDGALRSVTLVDLAGKARQATEWDGRILVWNFWATWCTPCREEIPLLAAASQKYGPSGVEIVGIAVDSAAKVRQFSSSFNIPYPILIAEAEGLELMRRLGNSSGGLPYTVIVDRQGGVIRRKLGALKQAELDAILGPLIGS
jgi:thiol-disulfide isomerase/thioredoxin